MAVANMVDLVEIDVQLTRDNILVCYHNNNLRGTPVREWLAAQIWEEFGTLVPRLDTVLQQLNEDSPETAVIIDCKHVNVPYLEEFCTAATESYYSYARLGCYCNHLKVLRKLKALSDMVLLRGTLSPNVPGKYVELVDGYMMGSNSVTKEAVARAHEAGKFTLVHRYGLNDYSWKDFLKLAIEIGSDGVLCGDTSVFIR
jgi:glycerophosphoryl diester phosphodiesterase